MGSFSDTRQSKFLILLVLSSFYNTFLIFRNGDLAFYRCKQRDCSIRVTLDVDTTTDIITDVRGSHLHENELLGSLIQVKVLEAKKRALEGAYAKPRAVFSDLMASIEADPETRMGICEF